jgi:hypothetical protein
MPPIDPLPYFPTLAKVLHGPTISLVMTYLEIYHQSPQDSVDRLPECSPGASDAPFTIDCDTVSEHLGISRRTLHIALTCLGCWWSTEDARSRAARAGREFINPNHSLGPTAHDPVKIYSVTGNRQYSRPQVLIMRRSLPKLASVLANAGLHTSSNHFTAKDDICAPSSSVLSLPQILLKMLPDWSDRRAERWDRWRRENGKTTRAYSRMRGAKDVRKMLPLADKPIESVGDADGEF